MYCRNCGKELPEGTIVCGFCGSYAEQPADPARADNADPDKMSDGYEVFDIYDGFPAPSPEPGYGVYDEFAEGESGKPGDGNEKGLANKEKEAGRSGVVVCALLSAFLALLFLAAAISGALRYVFRDGVIKESVADSSFEELYINSDDKRITFHDFLCGTIESAGQSLGLKKRDISKLIKERPIKEHFGEVFAEYKNRFIKGGEIEPYNCGDIADWMYENADAVKEVTGVKIDETARNTLKSALEATSLDLGIDSFEDLFGINRGAATFIMSDVFHYVVLVLCAGIAALIFVCCDFEFKKTFVYLGWAAIAVGVILIGAFVYLTIAGSDAGFLASLLLRAALKAVIIACAVSIFCGVAFLLAAHFIEIRIKKRTKALTNLE